MLKRTGAVGVGDARGVKMEKQKLREVAPRDEPLEHTLQQAVSHALTIIWHYRFKFTLESKTSLNGRFEDFCSSADHKSQEAIVDTLRSKMLLKEYGFLCEEEGVERWNGSGPYFTIDPIDGTNQYVKGNWHAVSVMGAAARGENVEAVCIGDLTTRDLISYGPTSVGVNYLSGEFHRLLPDTSLHTGDLDTSCMLLRRPLARYSPVIQKLAGEACDHLVTNESLGVWMPRLWKQEVRMAVLCSGSKVTPWDITPIIGVSRKLGYVFLRAVDNGTRLERFDPGLPIRETSRSSDVLIIHEHDLYLLQ